MDGEEVKKFLMEVCGWSIEGDGVVKILLNLENEVKKVEIREDVNVE